jgi:hypothetical protein
MEEGASMYAAALTKAALIAPAGSDADWATEYKKEWRRGLVDIRSQRQVLTRDSSQLPGLEDGCFKEILTQLGTTAIAIAGWLLKTWLDEVRTCLLSSGV